MDRCGIFCTQKNLSLQAATQFEITDYSALLVSRKSSQGTVTFSECFRLFISLLSCVITSYRIFFFAIMLLITVERRH